MDKKAVRPQAQKEAAGLHKQAQSDGAKTGESSERIEAKERLIVALDFPSAGQAMDLVDRLDGCCQWFKVGMELYYAAGNRVIEGLLERGYEVFLDLKLHDIPNTVAGAVRSVAGVGASLLTVHAGGGEQMMRAARRCWWWDVRSRRRRTRHRLRRGFWRRLPGRSKWVPHWGIPRAKTNKEIRGFFAALRMTNLWAATESVGCDRMTSKNGQRQEQGPIRRFWLRQNDDSVGCGQNDKS
jgi:hypothetical protein